MGGIIIFLIFLSFIILEIWFLSYPPISCNVMSENNIGGFYEAIGGVYAQVDTSSQLSSLYSKNPDLFTIITMRKYNDIRNSVFKPSFIMMLNKNMWVIYDTKLNRNVYINKPADPSLYINNPPSQGWVPADKSNQINISSKDNNSDSRIEDFSDLEVNMCVGSLQNSDSLSSHQDQTNIQKLLNRPVTTILLIIILYIAYYLYAYRIDVSSVSFSYSSVVMIGDYWRMVTASLSHFDLFHLGFNAMTLYQLGDLELVYGSLVYGYLSIALIFITMLICCCIYHVMIHKYNMVDMTYQEGVGYSCVLFAWMVALSVRLKSFCPIFFFPSFCFQTYFITIPSMNDYINLPINIGPLILLVITKVLIPRSSFIGHLSGIIIGYPLAWNMLNWLTPPILLTSLTILYIYKSQLFAWKLPGYEIYNNNLEDFVPADILKTYKILFLCLYFFCCSVIFSIYFQSFSQYISRLLLTFLLWNTIQARRCEFYLSDGPISNATHSDIAKIVVTCFVFAVFILLYDISNFFSTMAGYNLLIGCGLSIWYVKSNVLLQLVNIIVDIVLVIHLIFSMQDMIHCLIYATKLRLDKESVRSDLNKILCGLYYSNVTVPFSGRANRVGNVPSPTVELKNLSPTVTPTRTIEL